MCTYYVLDNIEHMNLNWINIYFSPQTVGVIVRLEKENFQILSMHNKVQWWIHWSNRWLVWLITLCHVFLDVFCCNYVLFTDTQFEASSSDKEERHKICCSFRFWEQQHSSQGCYQSHRWTSLGKYLHIWNFYTLNWSLGLYPWLYQ